MKKCEVWSCAWMGQKICASGAEDSHLKIWDLRCQSKKPQQINHKTHSAGIVFISKYQPIQYDQHREGLLFTGSYDDHLRLFDMRCLDSPLTEIKLNGGVWDIKQLHSGYIISACMYGGWSILHKNDSHSFDMVHCCTENGKNLLYGVDAFLNIDYANENGPINVFKIASCTFNDKTVRIERIRIYS